ncbi:hypothetical protein GQ600_2224 [Phytophthora cactorum]|nr:hypothetical protein GQ600_2224 [Phytophthora cactorum]
MNKGDPEKYAFLNSRLQCEKEEAEKAREHEIKWSCTVKKRNVHVTSGCWLLNVSVIIL